MDVLSLQMAIFLFTVCHVVIVTLESGDVDIIFRLGGGGGGGRGRIIAQQFFRFLWIAEKLKTLCCKNIEQDMMRYSIINFVYIFYFFLLK